MEFAYSYHIQNYLKHKSDVLLYIFYKLLRHLKILQIISPPKLFFLASISDITPFDVERIDRPKPFWILGILEALE